MALNETMTGGGERGRPMRVACLATHPIQYQAPLFRHIANSGLVDLSVVFLSDMSVRGYRDRGFGTALRWDVPLLEGYSCSFLPVWGGRGKLSFFRPLVGGLRRYLVAGKFDALWVHGYMHHALLRAIAWARALGIAVLLRGESNCLCDTSRGPRKSLKRALLPRLFAAIDGFLTIGSLNRDYYLAQGVPERRLFAMPYAVDNRFFRDRCREAAARRERMRADLALSRDRPIILFAGKFQARKRAADLIEAYARLSPGGGREPRPYLLLVGEGEEGPALRARAAALGWSSIRFLGFRNQTELPAFYDLCDLFVLPAQSEPWGLAINEVLNAEKPVVVSDQVGCHPDLVADGASGFVVPVGDISALAERMRWLVTSTEAARDMGREGARRVVRFSFEADLEGLMTALAALTAQSFHRPATD